MSAIIISYLFFLSSFNIVGCIIHDCCSDFRRWWKDGIKKVEIEWLFIVIHLHLLICFLVLCFHLCPVMLHINWHKWLAAIHQYEWRVLCRWMSTNATSKKDPLDDLRPHFRIIFQNLYQRVFYCSVLTFLTFYQSVCLRVISRRNFLLIYVVVCILHLEIPDLGRWFGFQSNHANTSPRTKIKQ